MEESGIGMSDDYMTVPNGEYECIGGPLCGSAIDAKFGNGRYCYRDRTDSKIKHYYRLVVLASGSKPRIALFFHYCGTSKKKAERMEPFLVPHRRMWKKAPMDW